jgi:alpha-glucoside transport system permease protein
MDLHAPILLAGLIVVPTAVMAYLFLGERVLRFAPAGGQRHARPALWLAPAVLLTLGVLIYPLGQTLLLSLYGKSSSSPSLANYIAIFTDGSLLDVLRVNLIWLVLYPIGCVAVGLLAAVLLERVRYARVAKAIITVPTAISFVASSVMWQLIYAYTPPGTPPTGSLNGFLQAVVPGFVPQAWLVSESTNNVALIVVGVWLGSGLTTLILSAALKGVAPELLEAARLDGAGEWRVFMNVIVPELRPALVIVGTTTIIVAIKIFDVVYVMTGGNYKTDVIATRMYSEQFAYGDTGLATALAVVLVIAVAPVVVMNLRAARRED